MTNLFLNFDLHLQNLFDPSKFHTLADSVFSSGQSLEFTLLVLFFSAIFSMYLILYIVFSLRGREDFTWQMSKATLGDLPHSNFLS
jgi:ABC-type enterochelin transport system permease subunit